MKLTKDITDLICDLEYNIGKKCFNAKTYNGRTNVQGLSYRYPVTFCREESDYEIKADYKMQYAVLEDITPEILKTAKYKMGANQLYIGKGLIDVLTELENRYGLDFNKLEEKYRQNLSTQ